MKKKITEAKTLSDKSAKKKKGGNMYHAIFKCIIKCYHQMLCLNSREVVVKVYII